MKQKEKERKKHTREINAWTIQNALIQLTLTLDENTYKMYT